MFYGYMTLKSLPHISKWNTHNVENMSEMLRKCSKLESLLDKSKWNIHKEINIAFFFSICSSLISLPYFLNGII